MLYGLLNQSCQCFYGGVTKTRGYRCLNFLWWSVELLTSFAPAVSASEQQDWQILLTQSRLFGHILWSCALQRERKRDRARETGCHPHHKATIPVSCCPSFPDPALVIEAHWLGWGREATIVRVSLFVNPQPPTLELTGVAKQQLTE